MQLFGINNQALPKQVNYMIDEAQTIGADGKKSHGPNSVISLLHHFMEVYGLHEKEYVLHADNCGRQHKNISVIAYLAWRVMTGLHEKISLSFMTAGHTRYLVDGCFGLLKQSYRRNDIYTLNQLADVVNSSAGCNTSYVLSDNDLLWSGSDDWLADFFKPIKGIRKLHHFVFSKNFPGVVKVKESLEAEEAEHSILRSSGSVETIQAAGLPPQLPRGALGAERSKYLYKEIRPLIPQAFQDQLCPAPPQAATEQATEAEPAILQAESD